MSNPCIKITETLLNNNLNVFGNHREGKNFFFYILNLLTSCVKNLAVQNKCFMWTMHTLPAEDVSSYTDQCQGPGSTDAGGADLDPQCKINLEYLLTILCWINDSSETEWPIPFVVKSFHFYLILSWRWHWFILVDIAANFRISNCNSSPFFLTKGLEGHYITKVIAIVVFSWQRL